MIVYVNTKEAGNEKPHVHIARGGRKRKGDLKWLIEEGDFDARTTKGFPKHKLNKLRAVLTIYREECFAAWAKVFGN